MAKRTDKVPENVTGKYYVDSECIYCMSCLDIAPENFDSKDEEYAYVKKQPETKAEEDQCREAMEACPTEAIGDDGD
jgi:ferredoxin